MSLLPIPTTAVPPPPPPRPLPRPLPLRTRPMQFGIFLVAICWVWLAHTLAAGAAQGFAVRLQLSDEEPLLEALFLVFLLCLGFAALHALERRKAPLAMSLGLPRRASSRREWATGAALGWGLALAAVLPIALGRALNVHLWTQPRAFFLFALALATLALSTLAQELALRGYPFQRLIDAIGPSRATILMALFAGVFALFSLGSAAGATAVSSAILVSLLLSAAWLRTHGLWLGWGLRFAWTVTITLFFGLPVTGDTTISSMVDTRTAGPDWLTGGGLGPEAALLTPLLLLIGIFFLIRLTTDYAWSYTHPPLIPAGYDVTIAPPAAHIAMQPAAVPPASLVQIQPATPPPTE